MFRRIFNILYYTFRALPNLHLLIPAAMGLGLGVGMSVVVFQNPVRTQATSDNYLLESHRLIAVEELNFKDQRLKTEDKNIFETIKSEGLGFDKLAIIEIKDTSYEKSLKNLNLGDEISVVGSNNGLYVFHLTQIRETSLEHLQQLIALQDKGLIVYLRKSRFNDRVMMILAR